MTQPAIITYMKGIAMGYISRRVSDLTGTEANDSEFLTLVVRRHPELEEPVQIDVLPKEISGLKSLTDLVVLEVKKNGDEPTQIVTTVADFNKLSGNMAEVLSNADGIRGRRKGFRPGARADA